LNLCGIAEVDDAFDEPHDSAAGLSLRMSRRIDSSVVSAKQACS
jgi:hypothetical protein